MTMISKKIRQSILGLSLSSALACILASTPALADAQAPTLKINGFTVVNAHFSKQQRRDNGKGGTEPHIGIGASDLYFTVTGKAANGMEYKYRINFETIPGANPYVNKNYVEVNGDFGTFQAGHVTGPEDTMPEAGAHLIGGANGIDGGLNSVYNMSAGVIKGVNFAAETKKTSKIVFYSPEALGFQLGVAFTPNTSHQGDASKNNATLGDWKGIGNSTGIYPDKSKGPFGTRNLVVGLTYKGSIEKWSYAFAAVGVTEKSNYVDPALSGQRRIPLQNAKAYQLSAAIGYDKWRFAAGWIDNGKSRLPKEPGFAYQQNGAAAPAGQHYLGNTALGNAGQAWNVGASYTIGAYQFAAAYHRTDRKTDATNKATSDIVAASVDFSALQGLKVFGELDLIRSRTNAGAVAIQQYYMDKVEGKSNKAIGDNSGAALVFGTKVSF